MALPSPDATGGIPTQTPDTTGRIIHAAQRFQQAESRGPQQQALTQDALEAKIAELTPRSNLVEREALVHEEIAINRLVQRDYDTDLKQEWDAAKLLVSNASRDNRQREMRTQLHTIWVKRAEKIIGKAQADDAAVPGMLAELFYGDATMVKGDLIDTAMGIYRKDLENWQREHAGEVVTQEARIDALAQAIEYSQGLWISPVEKAAKAIELADALRKENPSTGEEHLLNTQLRIFLEEPDKYEDVLRKAMARAVVVDENGNPVLKDGKVQEKTNLQIDREADTAEKRRAKIVERARAKPAVDRGRQIFDELKERAKNFRNVEKEDYKVLEAHELVKRTGIEFKALETIESIVVYPDEEFNNRLASLRQRAEDAKKLMQERETKKGESEDSRLDYEDAQRQYQELQRQIDWYEVAAKWKEENNKELVPPTEGNSTEQQRKELIARQIKEKREIFNRNLQVLYLAIKDSKYAPLHDPAVGEYLKSMSFDDDGGNAYLETDEISNGAISDETKKEGGIFGWGWKKRMKDLEVALGLLIAIVVGGGMDRVRDLSSAA